MPRSLALGNGHMLLLMDRYAHVREVYFPYVGLENHMGRNSLHRVGVYVDEQLHWLDNPAWKIDIRMKDHTLTSQTEATNDQLRVNLRFTDALYNEKNIFIRKVQVTNLSEEKRTIRLFFNQEFKISESRRGDTAFFEPKHNYLVHYKGRRVFLINMRVGSRGMDDYTTGQFGLPGSEGTFRDAEDGKLEKNPIRHGKVDSTASIAVDLGYQEEETLHYWMTIATSIQEAADLNAYVLDKTPDYIIETTQDFWHAWVNKQQHTFHGLSEQVVDLFKKSLLYVRTHIDNNGSILASGDTEMLHHGFDTYSYMWPRDGALTSLSLIRAGYVNKPRHFFELCNDILSEDGYLLHKYRPDGSFGSSWHPWIKDGSPSLPIQEDETALVLHALWAYYDKSKDLEFIEDVYDSLIQKAADFMVSYIDPQTQLPYPSYDLWEERHGTMTFTTAAVFAGLMAAARFADILGKKEAYERYQSTAERIREALLKYMYTEEDGFCRMINKEDTRVIYDKTTDMSSAYAIFSFGVLDAEDEKMKNMIRIVEERLLLKKGIGGVCRYQDDYYYRISPETPGNPWFITTLWLAQYYIRIAKCEEDLEPTKQWLEWTVQYSLSSGVLPEQLHPFTGETIAATPLTWSHAEYVETVIQYLEKIEELGVGQ